MGLLSSLFRKKKKKELVSVVAKKENSEHGHFVNIINDLAHYIDEVGEKGDPLKRMAYAYARRSAAAGLYIQGFLDKNEFEYQKSVFKGFQQTTGVSRQFQIDAHEQALDFIISYDERLNRTFVHAAMMLVEGGLDAPKDRGELYPYEQVMYVVKSMIDQDIVKVPSNIEQIQKTGKT
ncbi:hypothetical protein [Vibrio rotiferianus]|uniref:hypothetical protein n=1 Tax=Vibrio rotiferianus TaxID=190895 RepID=UPI00406AA800